MYYPLGCEGVKDLDGTFCQKNANRCTEPDIQKVCPQTCGDCGKFQIKFYSNFDGNYFLNRTSVVLAHNVFCNSM